MDVTTHGGLVHVWLNVSCSYGNACKGPFLIAWPNSFCLGEIGIAAIAPAAAAAAVTRARRLADDDMFGNNGKGATVRVRAVP